MKYVLIFSLLCGIGFGQSSHRDLTTELLKDLHKAIADSTSLSRDSLHVSFIDESTLGTFLNSCLLHTRSQTEMVQVGITTKDITLSINHTPANSVRNSRYLRQLELNVQFVYEQTEYAWKGTISDNLSKAQLKSLLDEDIPFTVRGDYSSGEPTGILIVLTTLGVFSLGAALFFIRT
ncbi:MAG: hypothetical protein H8E26_07170 [FCB group bacterium]|nr:hypothetical protein [FCB group bacterium]MBL7027889.1 hypothetical protein [Candidatus Neomarinimicrobiota bacterium]MBL7121898.1 hypothetical protein [Candidatus Neomarinimicrobiota bacterium]